MKQTISQKVDSGRSMVEMLGVLAVIGVLSVASILGYRYAMAKWRANETVNELNIRAYDIATRFDKLVAANTRDIEMEMGDTTKLGYPITARISPQYEDYFEIFVSNVPTDVCKELLNSQWQAPYSIFVGVEEYEANADICEQAENVQLAYEFYKDLSARDEIPEETRHKIQRCNHKNNCQCGTCNEEIGLCESDCEEGQLCLKRYDDPRWMKCCDKENKVGDFCCAYVEDGKCCNYDGNCCPPEKPLMDKNGNCYRCEESNRIDLEGITKNCSACPNRKIMADRYCAKKCEQGYFMDKDGICRSCNATAAYSVHGVESNCSACPNRFVDNAAPGNHCYLGCDSAENNTLGKPLNAEYGPCYSCNEPSSLNLNGNNAARCSKICKSRVLYGVICNMPCTDPQKPLMINEMGSCADCNTPERVPMSALTDKCEKLCTNREEKNGYCVLKTCASGYFMDKDRNCRSCNATAAYSVHGVEANCSACSNRFVDNAAPGNRCYLGCDSAENNTLGKPLNAESGSCYSCNEPSSLNLNGNNAARCSKICKNRKQRENNKAMCDRISCSEGTFESSGGTCYACDITTDIAVKDEEACKVCMNRKYQDGLCVENTGGK